MENREKETKAEGEETGGSAPTRYSAMRANRSRTSGGKGKRVEGEGRVRW